MPYVRLANDSALANSTTLAQLGATSNIPINSDWIAEISLRIDLAAGNGGLRFNLRLPTASVAFILEPFTAAESDRTTPPLGIPWAGIGINIGAAPQDYFHLDFGGAAFTGIIYGQIGLRVNGTTGPAVVEVCRNRLGASGTTTIQAFSILSARTP